MIFEQELRRQARIEALEQDADMDPISLIDLEEEIYQRLLKERNAQN
jgi:hypothetical protein